MIELDKIYNEDCLEGMKRIDDGSIDAVICDLPYGTTKNLWDSLIPLDDLWAQYKRIVKPAGAIVLFGQQPFTSALVMSNPSMFKYEWIWKKDNATGFLNAEFAPLKSHENILVFSQKAACFVKDKSDAMVFNPQKTQGTPYRCKQGYMSTSYDYKNSRETITISNGDRYPIDIIQYNRDRDGFHPTQKPVDLIRYLVLTYTNEGDTILDNCSGSGTTAVAAWREKRHFICFEKDPVYWEKSIKRLKVEMMQLRLF